MNLHACGLLGYCARLAAAILVFVGLASCGSGGVSGPAQVNDPSRITILPATATLFGGLATTFTISGGTGSYIVSSSNQTVINVSGPIPTGSLTVVPNQVTADTTVTLTVRDTGTTPVATATLTVRPGTVMNDVQITPTSTQGGSCSPALCSGSDALVTATIAQGGVALPARGVRFEVVSGDFLFISSPLDAQVETLAASYVTVSDEAGKARSRIRIPANAANQTAILQITDLGTLAFQRAAFTIAQATGTSPGFFATPSQLTFVGPNQEQCATTGSADFFIFGGTPPYRITSVGSAFEVTRDFVGASGGSFSVRPTGTCVAEPGLPITIVDASGRTTTVRVANIAGAAAVPALVVGPDEVTLSSCQSSASVTANGGTGRFSASSGSDALFVQQTSANSFAIQRRNPSPAPGAGPLTVGISDGRTTTSVTVNLVGEAQGPCPAPLVVTPSSINVTTCGVHSATISGGAGIGTYTAVSNNAAIRATISSNQLNVQRASGAFGSPSPATVTVSDISGQSFNVTVNNGAGAPATCP